MQVGDAGRGCFRSAWVSVVVVEVSTEVWRHSDCGSTRTRDVGTVAFRGVVAWRILLSRRHLFKKYFTIFCINKFLI